MSIVAERKKEKKRMQKIHGNRDMAWKYGSLCFVDVLGKSIGNVSDARELRKPPRPVERQEASWRSSSRW